MSRILFKYCPYCGFDTDQSVDKLQHVSEETFELDTTCTICSTPFHGFIEHDRLIEIPWKNWDQKLEVLV